MQMEKRNQVNEGESRDDTLEVITNDSMHFPTRVGRIAPDVAPDHILNIDK